MRVRAFLSYSTRDRSTAEQLQQALENDEVAVWRDATEVRHDWSRDISQALVEAQALVLLWTESSATSPWVRNEWLTARALGRRIVPAEDLVVVGDDSGNVGCLKLIEA